MFDFTYIQALGWAMVLGLIGFSFYPGALVIRKLRKEKGNPLSPNYFEGKGLHWSVWLVIEIAFVLSAFIGFIVASIEGRLGIDLPWSIGASWLMLIWLTSMLLLTIRRLQKYQPPIRGGGGDITQGLP